MYVDYYHNRFLRGDTHDSSSLQRADIQLTAVVDWDIRLYFRVWQRAAGNPHRLETIQYSNRQHTGVTGDNGRHGWLAGAACWGCPTAELNLSAATMSATCVEDGTLSLVLFLKRARLL